MKKKIIMTIAALGVAMYTMAAVTITTSAKTFQKAGGAASVVVQGDGSWTATSDSTWIVIKSGASGTGAGSVVYVVNANATADVRIGHINIGGNTYTITQYGYDATISPTSATFDRYGGNGTISVTVDAGVSWSAVANNDWITVSPASGTSVGTVSYTVAEYPGVVSRVGSITIGGQTFTITQTGVDVSISPEKTMKGEDADIIAVTVTALATTQWTVTPNVSWISVIDKATGYGDYVLTLAINANPSFVRRTGTVSIGTATFTIVQEGTKTASLSITPETATAAASGAYGNVAVYATPDAAWTAESTAPWLTISEGAAGSGNGNIKYVASANPTLSSRTGQIVVTPPHKVIEPDLYRGLLFWIKDQYNIEGNEPRRTTYALSKTYDGSFYNQLEGFPLIGGKFTLCFSFKLNDVNRINRLLQICDRSYYFDEEIKLMYNFPGNSPVTLASCNFNAGTWYTMLIKQETTEAHGVSFYMGPKGNELKKFADSWNGWMLPSSTSANQIKFGYCSRPTAGNLIGGQFSNIRFWRRALTDMECELVDVNQSAAMSEDDAPLGVPDGVKWDYFPLDGNAYRTKSTSMAALVQNTTLTNWTDSADRYGATYGAVSSTGNGRMTISNFETLFSGSYTLNNGKTLNATSGNYSYKYTISASNYSFTYYYPYPAKSNSGSEDDASYSVWVLVRTLPTSGSVKLFERSVTYMDNSQSPHEVEPHKSNRSLSLSLSSNGRLLIAGSGVTSTTFTKNVSTNEWHMITIVGKANTSIQAFFDGAEIGNVVSTMVLGYLPPIDRRYYYNGSISGAAQSNNATFTLGGWDGAADGLTFFHSALTSAQVRELYDRQKAQKVYHTVTQGVQSPQLNKSQVTAPAEGSTESVALTLAQSVQWTARSNSSWIQITSDTAGAGSANISFTVGANPAVTSRTGSITVAGKNVTVVQEGLWADVMTDDSSFGVGSDYGTLWVETEGGGTWTASTDVDWIHLFDESGTGSTPVMFVVDDYTTTTASRSGIITIAGKKIVITQQGYELSIDPQVAEVGSNAGAGQFGVSAPIDAVWEAIADCDWITIIGARTGIGDGTIQYTIADNLTGETRTGRIVIAGKTYTITQKTTLPVTTTAIGSGTVTGAGNYNQGTSVTLTATPAAGYVFSHWSGDAVGVTNQVAISVDTPKEVTATFIPESAAEQLAAAKAAQGGFYTRDQIHALEVGNLVFDVDSASGTARVGVQLMETSDLSDPNSWRPVGMTAGNLDVGLDGTVGLNVPATGNAKFFKVVVPDKK